MTSGAKRPGKEDMFNGSKSEASKDIVPCGSLLKGQWRVKGTLGAGGFGHVYLGQDVDSGVEVAIKTQSTASRRMVLAMDAAVLKAMTGSADVPRLLGRGCTPRYHFLVMSLHGRSLSVLRKEQPGARFSLATACELGIRCLQGIRSIHEHGILHRDIKPSNFVLGLHEERQRVIVVDFGLARFFRAENGQVRPPRTFAGFRGTARYAPLAAHNNCELSRRDDLWSFFYMLVEFIQGQLPWRRHRDKEAIAQLKILHSPAELIAKMPAPLSRLLALIKDLGYYDTPPYTEIEACLSEIIKLQGLSRPIVYEWDRDISTGTFSQTSHFSLVGSSELLAEGPPEAAAACPTHRIASKTNSAASGDKRPAPPPRASRKPRPPISGPPPRRHIVRASAVV